MSPVSGNLYRPTSYSAEMYEQAIMERNEARRERDALRQALVNWADQAVYPGKSPDDPDDDAHRALYLILPRDNWGLAPREEDKQ